MAFDPIGYINTPRWQQQRLGLERITALMEKLGNPQNDLPFVHVAGTNGKGSVCAYLASILESSGSRTGLFTSPYIERFEERIRINGNNIGESELCDVTLAMRDAAEELEREMGEHPTEFELMTAVALLYFARQRCDIAVIEVGLGGRLDSTNIISPQVSVITRIGLDHTGILGDTLGKIALEKAGIAKPGIPVVAYPQEREVMGVIERVCEERGCRLLIPDFADIEVDRVSPAGRRGFRFNGRHYETSLLATYQPYNASLAIAVAGVLSELGWRISADDIEKGIRSAKWPGRFEVASQDPLFIVDGAHNPQGAGELRSSLEDMFRAVPSAAVGLPGTTVQSEVVGLSETAAPSSDAAASCSGTEAVFVVGVLADKDYEGMMDAVMFGTCAEHAMSDGSDDDRGASGAEPSVGDELRRPPLFEKATFITYTPDNPRALASDVLADKIKAYAENDLARAPLDTIRCDTPEEATRLAIEIASLADSDNGKVIVAFGTLYAIGQIKSALRSLYSPAGTNRP